MSKGQDETNTVSFWEAVHSAFLSQEIKIYSERTAESLRSRWGTLERLVQKYLAAKSVYLSKPVSRETSCDAAQNVMRLYCSGNKRKDAYGVLRDGPVLKSMRAVDVLRRCPNFGAQGLKSKDTTRKSNISNYDDPLLSKYNLKPCS